jgi:hypothetical protein
MATVGELLLGWVNGGARRASVGSQWRFLVAMAVMPARAIDFWTSAGTVAVVLVAYGPTVYPARPQRIRSDT